MADSSNKKLMQSMSICEKVDVLDQRIAQVEGRFVDMGYNVKSFVQTSIKNSWQVPTQANTLHGMYTAICVSTVDVLKQGRVQFFTPLLYDPESPVGSIPWAYPISNQGGFDDAGCTWVPPAGSKLCLIFEAGNRECPFYLGTTWDRDRSKGWGYPMPEYEKIHRGHRGGYLTAEDEGKEDEVFPPWNTENYNGIDMDSTSQLEQDPEARNKITYPNIYGWKTPQKHMIKMVDGNYKCNFRWQRMELKSAQGNHLIFKDDRVHPSAQWAHPKCGCGGGDLSNCNEGDEPKERSDSCPTQTEDGTCSNPYFKHRSECRPYMGPGNCQNNKVDKVSLPQSGIQMTSLSGHTLWMDDSVNEPKGKNNWERSSQKFDYGCDDVFKGKTVWKSAHGHQMVMSDVETEDKPYLRGEENFIRILTATGNRIELNDDTKKCDCACPDCACGCEGTTKQAGPRRGIELQSTSNHVIQMIDENNEQCSPNRREGGVPVNKATNAFVRIRSGYGLEIMMADDNHQEDTQSQYIQIMAPQKDACCGPHIIRMQESDSCGFIYIRAGGDYVCMTEGDHVTVVGAGNKTPKDDFCKGGCLGPKNWFTLVSKHSLHSSCNFYFNKAEIHAFIADRMILLLAGKDCPPPPDEDGVQRNFQCNPCIGSVVVLVSDPVKKTTRLVASDRVFASASLESRCITFFDLAIQAKCGSTNCPPPFISNKE